ncbi:hypothetical protein [Candidatus Magnetaquicoccus inordinatus]|uniref:hypothetical protein n=1 Tax=Candidatus Magnetaquicoccus inordinatus TaxID=2496818 RepID=UPI00187D16F4|nr:hypothetical protein [Candidatus Magnetaquicoccus inordinatus]
MAWHWHSTPESIKKGELSILALLETLLAVVLTWSVAIYYNFYIIIIASLCVSLIQLFRSEESVRTGVRWFKNYWEQDKFSHKETPVLFWTTIGVSLLAFFFTIFWLAQSYFWLAQSYLTGTVAWSLFWRSFLLGLLARIIGAAAGAITGAATGATAGAAAGAAALAGAVAASGVGTSTGTAVIVGAAAAVGVGTGTGTAAIVSAEAASLAAVIAVAGMVAGVIAGAKAETARGVIARVVSVTESAATSVVVVVTGAFGIWLRSLFTRLAATMRHLDSGCFAIPKNWWQTIGIIDLFHPPELIPGGVAISDELSGTYWIKEFPAKITGIKIINYISHLFIIFIFFAPAFCYRWSLKSSCWFYLPLLYLVPPSKEEISGHKGEDLLCGLYNGRSEWRNRLLAIYFVVGMFLLYWQTPLIADIRAQITKAPVLFYALFIDLNRLPVWQWPLLPSIALTYFIYFASDKYYQSWQNRLRLNPATAPDPTDVQRLLWLHNIRTFCTFAYFLLFGFYAFAVLWSQEHCLPDFPRQILNWLYGPAWISPPLPASCSSFPPET